jgi:hypothetical protein
MKRIRKIKPQQETLHILKIKLQHETIRVLTMHDLRRVAGCGEDTASGRCNTEDALAVDGS